MGTRLACSNYFARGSGKPSVRFDGEEGACLPALLVRNISYRFLASLFLGSVLAILIVGLWPFGYPIPNRVTVLSDAPGIRFTGSKGRAKLNAGGVVYTPGPLTIHRTKHSAPGSMTLVFKAEAASEFI